MHWMNVVALAFGHAWIVLMILRIPCTVYEGRDFYACMKHLKAKNHVLLFTLWRFSIPNLLSSPTLLLMHGWKIFTPSESTEVYEAALALTRMYDVDLAYGEDEGEEELPIERPGSVEPYNRKLQTESVDEVISKAIEQSTERGRIEGDAERTDPSRIRPPS